MRVSTRSKRRSKARRCSISLPSWKRSSSKCPSCADRSRCSTTASRIRPSASATCISISIRACAGSSSRAGAPAAEAPPPAAAAAAPPRASAASRSAAVAVANVDSGVETRAYEAAQGQRRIGNYQGAIVAFQNFIKQYPKSNLAPRARYWIGDSYFNLRDFKLAIGSQQTLLKTYPDSPTVPDSLLNIASSQIELGEVGERQKDARRTGRQIPGQRGRGKSAAPHRGDECAGCARCYRAARRQAVGLRR